MRNDFHIFIVNLKSDIEKKEHMKKLCSDIGFSAEFIEATDGRLLSENYIETIYSKNKSIETIGRELSRSEVGCALSHKAIYQKMVDDNIESALVFEDDINFDQVLSCIIDKSSLVAKKWDVILLGHHMGEDRNKDTRPSYWGSRKITHDFSLCRPCEKAYGTYGYLISLTGARKLLNNLELIDRPIDHYTGSDARLNLYTVNPAPVRINDYLSENMSSMADRTDLDVQLSECMKSLGDSTKKRLAQKVGLYKYFVELRYQARITRDRFKLPRKYT